MVEDGEQRLMRKLKSENGESIGEVLVAMLVVSLGSILFASMVTASQRLVTRSNKAYQSYVTSRNQMESESGNTISTESSSVSIKEDPTSSSTTNNRNVCQINAQAKEGVRVYINKGAQDGVTQKFIYETESDTDSQSDGGSGS